jgi:hypothetical protein
MFSKVGYSVTVADATPWPARGAAGAFSPAQTTVTPITAHIATISHIFFMLLPVLTADLSGFLPYIASIPFARLYHLDKSKTLKLSYCPSLSYTCRNPNLPAP